MAIDTPSPHAPKPPKIRRFKISFNILVQIFALLLILLMLNYLSFYHYRRWDFTRTHRYLLSEKTRRVLAGLKKTVKVVVVFPATSEISIDVNNLLKEYQYSSNGKIEVEIIDLDRNPTRANELENTYKFDPKESLVILDYNGRKKFVKAVDLVDLDTSGEMYGPPLLKDFKGEQAITGGLLELCDDKPNILYTITGHGERDLTGEDFKTVREPIEREDVTVKTLDLQNVDAVPKDAGILFILGARYDFTEREIKMLQDYWDKKGRLFILLDPDAQPQTTRLLTFLAEQGVEAENDRVMHIARMRLTQSAALATPEFDVTGDFTEGNPITKNLKGATAVFLGGAQSLTLNEAGARKAGIRVQMLVGASEGYWGEIDYNVKPKDSDPLPYFNPKKGDFGPPLAIVASVEKGALASQVQVDSSRMIAAGNWQFISQQSLAQPNLDFTINAVDWLLDRTELIGITPKSYSSLTLNLTQSQLSNIMGIVMLYIPAAAGAFGFALWWKRRH